MVYASVRRFHYDVTDSTNTQARLLAAAHPRECLVVTAAMQSAGRGRHGREWQSPLGGAWMSVVWPARKKPLFYTPVSLVAAVAVRRALVEIVGNNPPDFSIKWPNDLLIAERKVAGILCEQVPPEGDRRLGLLIIGIGVNVDFDPASLAEDLRHPATTLSAALHRSIDVERVIEVVSRHVERAMTSFESEGLGADILAQLRAHLAYVGTLRSWSSPHGTITGRVQGVDDTGRLLIDGEAGQVACEVGEFVV